jgi:hypothetical protein
MEDEGEYNALQQEDKRSPLNLIILVYSPRIPRITLENTPKL